MSDQREVFAQTEPLGYQVDILRMHQSLCKQHEPSSLMRASSVKDTHYCISFFSPFLCVEYRYSNFMGERVKGTTRFHPPSSLQTKQNHNWGLQARLANIRSNRADNLLSRQQEALNVPWHSSCRLVIPTLSIKGICSGGEENYSRYEMKIWSTI